MNPKGGNFWMKVKIMRKKGQFLRYVIGFQGQKVITMNQKSEQMDKKGNFFRVQVKIKGTNGKI